MFVEVTDPQVIDDLARSQLLWYRARGGGIELPYSYAPADDVLPSQCRLIFDYYILVEE